MRIKLLAVVISLVALHLTGCATSTMIISNPPGAEVTQQGRSLGQTPVRYETSMWIMSSETVDVKSPSGEVQSITLRRSEIDPLPFVASLGACFCFGWTGIGLAGGIVYFAGGWKLPDETVVNFAQRPASISRGTPVAMVSRKKRGLAW